jgi:hypothetical protein
MGVLFIALLHSLALMLLHQRIFSMNTVQAILMEEIEVLGAVRQKTTLRTGQVVAATVVVHR